VITPVALVLIAIAAVSAWSSWRTRDKLRDRLRAEWGGTTERARDMEAIADYFLSHPAGPSLDDRTWADLLLDDVFAFLDRTESTVGQQMLYRRLRLAQTPRALDAFDAIASQAERDLPLRERLQSALARLRDSAGYFLHRLADPDTLTRKWWHFVFPVWTAVIAVMLALGVVWPVFFFIALLGFIVNFAVRILTGRRVGGELVWFRQVGPLISTAQTLLACDAESTATLTGTLKADLAALRRLAAIARWVSRGSGTGAGLDLASLITETLSNLFLLDVNAVYFAGREMLANGPQLLRVIEAVGEIDAAIAVASFRAGDGNWIRPAFAAADTPATFTELRHPLLDDPIPNSIALAPPHGVLITGSNMSGKSTFLRTVGVNVVLAQSINTCLARGYHAPVYQVRSCIGRSDDLAAGKSYYQVEVESVLALVKASQAVEPQLFIFDELFRGTNAVERIAAAEAVLHALVGDGRPHVVLAATHDAELVDLLRASYAVFHLSDGIGPDGLTFDYRLTPGPATSRNAITLLQLNGAPQSLVDRALARAAALDRARSVRL
jgi:hypothetical protein